ncbi:hypothetical protein UFOVP1361_11 [uncultured Caudovirales phage]|uniref:Uncharacterized protein n=1 Tax=uncultured Caudovirales phage TaxID=2100421 RepID=A0A6J5RU92_9CAUD|nr:hypothetical protein UFOVP1361_11 [uncultured Caudovirales phage]
MMFHSYFEGDTRAHVGDSPYVVSYVDDCFISFPTTSEGMLGKCSSSGESEYGSNQYSDVNDDYSSYVCLSKKGE